MNFVIVDEPRTQPRLGVVLWVLATLIGIPAGMALMNEIASRNVRWTAMAFPATVFVTQYVALAMAGRSRPLLIPLGVALALGAAFCTREMIPRDVSDEVRFAAYGLFFGVAWAGALAQNGKQAGLWILLGTLSVAAGLWFIDEIFRSTRGSISARDTRRVVASLGLAIPVALATTPLVWTHLRTRTARGQRADAPRPPAADSLPVGHIALVLAGLYLLALGGSTAYGAVQAKEQREKPARTFALPSKSRDTYPHNALDLGALNWVLAAACLLVGVGLLARVDAARYAFQVAAPAGALAFASVFAQDYWQDDLPQTVLFALPFAVFVFALGRRPAIAATRRATPDTARYGGAIARGLPWAIGLLAVAFCAYLILKGNKPVRGRGFGARGYANRLDALNEYVKHLAVAYVFLWHAVPGLLAAAIPGLGRRASGLSDGGVRSSAADGASTGADVAGPAQDEGGDAPEAPPPDVEA